ncbi:GldG family protein [Magnetospira thiophila]
MRRLTHMDRSRLAVLGLILGAIILLSVNVFANVALRGWRLDLTEDRLYTLSPSTQQVLRDIDEPVRLRLYFSEVLGEAVPSLTTYYRRIRELLEHYQDLSDGRVIVEIIHPQPFSDEEDRAVAAGLKGLAINDGGDLAYFGLEGTNAVDGLQVIPFFAPEREAFIEYDLTRLIHVLSRAQQPVVGLISTLPVNGAFPQTGRPWVIADLMREFFELRDLGTDFHRLDADLDLLMVVHPRDLPPRVLYAIDQFVLGGGRALVFVDGFAERAPEGAEESDFNQLLKKWGLRLRPGAVAGDREAARRVSTQAPDGRPVISDYVAWLALQPENMEGSDVVTGDLKVLNLATAGVLEPLPGRLTQVTPLLHTGVEAMLLDSADFRSRPDVVALFRDFQPGGAALLLGARVSGEVDTAFPDGPPAEPGLLSGADDSLHLPRSASPINVMVFSDSDMLQDRFWVRIEERAGQRLMVPFSNNGDLVINALENLSGGSALAGLRARGRSERPFKLVEDIRKRAEMRYRANEQTLLDRLKDLSAKSRALGAGDARNDGLLLSAADRLEAEKIKGEMTATRKALRNVQHVLRQDIEALDGWLKFANIIAMPLLVGLIMLAVAWQRQRRSSRRRLLKKAGSRP